MRIESPPSKPPTLSYIVLVALVAVVVVTFATTMTTKNPVETTAVPASTPIIISSNSDFATYASSGDGTKGNPWVIKDKFFSISSGTAIQISNTNNYFIIQNCTITGTGSGNGGGITMQDVKNGKVIKCNMTSVGLGIMAWGSTDGSTDNLVLTRNMVKSSGCGFKLFTGVTNAYIVNNTFDRVCDGTSNTAPVDVFCKNLTIAGNIFTTTNGYYGILDGGSENVSIRDNYFAYHAYSIAKHGTSVVKYLKNYTICNNTFAAYVDAVKISFFGNITIARNKVLPKVASGFGFDLVNCYNMTVVENVFKPYVNTKGTIPIGLIGSGNSLIFNNTIYTPSTVYIYLGSGSNNNVIRSNYLYNNVVEPTTSTVPVINIHDTNTNNNLIYENIFMQGEIQDNAVNNSFFNPVTRRGNYYRRLAPPSSAIIDNGVYMNCGAFFYSSKIGFDAFPLTADWVKAINLSTIIESPSTVSGQSSMTIRATATSWRGKTITGMTCTTSNASWNSGNQTMTKTGGTYSNSTWEYAVLSDTFNRLTDGKIYTVKVYATDSAGLVNSMTKTVFINKAGRPAIDITVPNVPEFTVKTMLTVNATATDTDGIDSAWTRVRNATFTGSNDTMTLKDGVYTITLNVSSLYQGTWYIDVFARDTIGNELVTTTWIVLYPGFVASKIWIFNTADFVKYASSGDGSHGDPYVLKNYKIDMELYHDFSGTTPAFWVMSTMDHFIIRGCKFYSSRSQQNNEQAIYLSKASNCRIESCYFDGVVVPVLAYNSPSITPGDFSIITSTFVYCGDVTIDSLIDTVLFENNTLLNSGGIYVRSLGAGCTIKGNTIRDTVAASHAISITDSNAMILKNTITRSVNGIKLAGNIPSLAFTVMNNTFNNDGVMISQHVLITLFSTPIQSKMSIVLIRDNRFMSDIDKSAIIIYAGLIDITGNRFERCGIANFVSEGNQNMFVYNNTFAIGGGRFVESNRNDVWDNGTIGNLWWDYEIKYPRATNDGKIWNTPYYVCGHYMYDTLPLVDPLSTTAVAGFLAPESAIASNTITVTVSLKRPGITDCIYSITKGTTVYGNYTMTDMGENDFSDTRAFPSLTNGEITVTVYMLFTGESTYHVIAKRASLFMLELIVIKPNANGIVTGDFEIVTSSSPEITTVWFRIRNSAGVSANFTMSQNATAFFYTFFWNTYGGKRTENWIDVFGSFVDDTVLKAIPVRFLYNFNPTVISVTSPSGTITTTPITVSAVIGDPDGIAEVRSEIQDPGGNVFYGSITAYGGGTSVMYQSNMGIPPSPSIGTYTARILTKDIFGLITTSSWTFIFSSITTVTIMAPAKDSIITGPFTITAECTDVIAVDVKIHGTTSTGAIPMTHGTGNLYSTTFDPSTFTGMASMNVIEVIASKTGGGNTSSSITFYYNAFPASITITSPATYITASSMTITATCTDPDGISMVEYAMTGEPGVVEGVLTNIGGNTYQKTITINTYSSSSHVITVTVVDTFNFETNSGKTVNIDHTPPSISPSVTFGNNTFIPPQSIAIVGTTIDEYPGSVTFRIRINGTWGTETATSVYGDNYFANLYAIPVQSGMYQIKYTVRSASGLSAWKIIAFTVDAGPPRIDTTSFPAEGERIITSPLVIIVHVTDDLGISIVNTTTWKGAWSTTQPMIDAGGMYTASIDLSGAPDGIYTIRVVATDIAGANTTIARSIRIDLRPPAVAIISPSPGSVLTSDTQDITISIVFSVADEDPELASFRVYNDTWSSTVMTVPLNGSGTITMMQTIVNATDGAYTMEIIIQSNSGYSVTRSVAVTIDVTEPVPPQPPSILDQIIAAIVAFISAILALLGIAAIASKRKRDLPGVSL